MYWRGGGGTMSFSRAVSTSLPTADEPSGAETLAAALELQRVDDGANSWIVHVLGVHNDGRHLWVQVAPDPGAKQSIVLRMSMSATARHALAALATLSPASLPYSGVVSVMCTV